MFCQFDIAQMRGFIESRHEQARMNRDGDPARWSFPPQFIYRASRQDKGGARLRTKLERLTVRPYLVFDRPSQHDVDKMLHMLVSWNHTSRHRIVFEHEP